MEVESVDEGVVGKIFIAAGTEGVKVNEILAVLLEAGEDANSIDITSATQTKTSESATKPEPVSKQSSVANSKLSSEPTPAQVMQSNSTRVFSSPLARRIASQNNVDISQITGTGPHGRIIQRDIESYLALDPSKRSVAKKRCFSTRTWNQWRSSY